MSDEAKLREQASKALRANSEFELVGESLAALEAEYIAAWRDTPARDSDARERLWQAVQIVGKVEKHLKSMINNGKLAEREMAEIARMGERKKFLNIV